MKYLMDEKGDKALFFETKEAAYHAIFEKELADPDFAAAIVECGMGYNVALKEGGES